MHSYRIRSFVRRDSRETPGQARAYRQRWPQFGVEIGEGILDFVNLFGRKAPCILEIGFGSGQSLLEAARIYPHINFIGVETHRPGIGSLLMAMEHQQIANIKIIKNDVVDLLGYLPNEGLEGINIFFPDPWPKRKHHARRLVQTSFMLQLLSKLKSKGSLHLATDWQDYAKHMLQVLNNLPLQNTASTPPFAARSPYRPVVTKFEQRAYVAQRTIWELHFVKL